MTWVFKHEEKEETRNGESISAEIDLQAVLYCPKTRAKSRLYERRFPVCSLTVLDVGGYKVECYIRMWDEAAGK
jgi:hypothetical protein